MAQLVWSGSVDFEVAQGGKDSHFVSNELATDYRNAHLSISQFNIFTQAQIDDQFSFNARLQWDTWGTGLLGKMRLSLAYLNWADENTPLSLSVGRFIMPFGLYPRRQLAADNLFAQAPLVYGYFINISEIHGFWPMAGNTGIYGNDDVGVNTIYLGGYSTGGMLNLNLIPDRINWEVALTNAAAASPAEYTNLSNYGLISRLGFQPLIFWQQGISAGYGSFIQKHISNQSWGKLERFRQLVLGTDLVVGYSYFELSGEFVYSIWNVPAYTQMQYVVETPWTLAEFKLKNYGAYLDLKYEPSFLTGCYLAVRYDILQFEKYTHPTATTEITLNPWDHDVYRYGVALGYKLSRQVLLKLCYMDQEIKNIYPQPEDYAFRAMLTATF
jgi:hypothetical protein